MDARSIGLSMGIIVGLILCVVIFKFWNKDGKVRTKYDEKQELTRGRAYKYAFWTLAAFECLMCMITGFGVSLHADMFTLHLSGIMIAAFVHATYSVWNDAYIGLNTNSRRFIICVILIALVNLLSAAMAIISGNIVKDGVLQPPFTNLLCALVFMAVGVELIIKNRIEKNDEED